MINNSLAEKNVFLSLVENSFCAFVSSQIGCCWLLE